MVDEERTERERVEGERPRPARPERTGPLGSIAGTDPGALGTGGTQRLDAPHAKVDDTEKPAPARADEPPLEGYDENDPNGEEGSPERG